MKTRIKWIVAIVAVVVGVAWLLGNRVQAEGQETPQEGDRVAELEKEVQLLRDTVARL
jgi:lipopolysaccharide export system protein LptC